MCSAYQLEQQRLRRSGLIAHLNTLKTLLRQGIAIRGNSDEESNIIQFNLDKAKEVPGLKLMMTEQKYLAHDILQEQEELLVLQARRNLLSSIGRDRCYSIIADESMDVTKLEQISVSLRTCNDNYDVEENFVGVLQYDHGFTADALLEYVKDVIIRCNLNTSKLVGLAFDGASVMKSLANKLKSEVGTQASYIHCFAHCNELVVKDAQSKSSLISESLDLCEELYALVGALPKARFTI
jgi:hypothetical protein